MLHSDDLLHQIAISLVEYPRLDRFGKIVQLTDLRENQFMQLLAGLPESRNCEDTYDLVVKGISPAPEHWQYVLMRWVLEWTKAAHWLEQQQDFWRLPQPSKANWNWLYRTRPDHPALIEWRRLTIRSIQLGKT